MNGKKSSDEWHSFLLSRISWPSSDRMCTSIAINYGHILSCWLVQIRAAPLLAAIDAYLRMLRFSYRFRAYSAADPAHFLVSYRTLLPPLPLALFDCSALSSQLLLINSGRGVEETVARKLVGVSIR
jgi:hypothetical protein